MKQTAIYLSGYGLFALASLAIISGAALIYSPHEVGILSIVIAIQFLLSQSAGVGMHFSALYHDSNNDVERAAPMHGLLNVMLCSGAISLAFYWLFPTVAGAIYSPEVVSYAGHLSIYAVLVAANKVFMAQLNAKQRFGAIGWLFALKAAVALTMIAWSHLMQWPLSGFIASVILLPEAFGFGIFVVYALYGLRSFSPTDAIMLFQRDLSYGIKALWGALFLDSSTKVDVLMLGAFTDAKTTGIYTFISLASDLFLQFTTLVRSWVNPRITKVYMEHDRPTFLKFLKEQAKQSYLLGVGFMVLVCAGFAVLTYAVPDYAVYRTGLQALIVLSLFLSLCAGFFPLLQVFGQIGRPMTQSVTYALLFISNVLFNLLFIPWFGMVGAALGTGLAYVVYVVVFLELIDRAAHA